MNNSTTSTPDTSKKSVLIALKEWLSERYPECETEYSVHLYNGSIIFFCDSVIHFFIEDDFLLMRWTGGDVVLDSKLRYLANQQLYLGDPMLFDRLTDVINTKIHGTGT